MHRSVEEREARLAEREAAVAERERICTLREDALAAQKPLLPPRVVDSASTPASTDSPSWCSLSAIEPSAFSDPSWTAQLRSEVAAASTERAWLLTLVATIRAWLRSHEADGTANLSRVLSSGGSFGSADGVLERCAAHFRVKGATSRALARGSRRASSPV